MPQTGGLNSRNAISSQFWRLELWDPGPGNLSLANSHLCPHVTFPLYSSRHRYSSVHSGWLYFEAYRYHRSITRPWINVLITQCSWYQMMIMPTLQDYTEHEAAFLRPKAHSTGLKHTGFWGGSQSNLGKHIIKYCNVIILNYNSQILWLCNNDSKIPQS